MIYSPGPGETMAIPTAVAWLQGALTGSAAMAIAVVAVASLGFMAFSGRVDLKRSVQTILGCFIVFGAPAIAAGLHDTLSSTGQPPETRAIVQYESPLTPPASEVEVPSSRAMPFDPYAGAAVAPR